MEPRLQKEFDLLQKELRLLFQELKVHSNNVLNKKPKPDKWSTLQVLYHLQVAEEGSLNYVKKKLSFNPELKSVNIGSKLREKTINFYMGLPFKFKAPPHVGDGAIPELSEFWTLVSKWRNQRDELGAFLETIPSDLVNKQIFKHPSAGRISLLGMLKFFRAHIKRHKKQINRNLKDYQYVV